MTQHIFSRNDLPIIMAILGILATVSTPKFAEAPTLASAILTDDYFVQKQRIIGAYP